MNRNKLSFLSTPFAMLFVLFYSATALASRLPDFTDLAKENSPAVVNISTSQTVASNGHPGLPPGFTIPDLPEDSPFNDFLHRFFGEQGGAGPEGVPDHEVQSLGSGFIISADGYILTNHHVITKADTILVRLNDRRSFDAKVIGSDEASDVALLKIDAKDLPTVKIGKSSELEVGEWVLAIGSPFGFDHTVTQGIVSAKGRSLPSDNYVPFIQTDVAINPGNSGGPLFDMDGEVVGINSQIYSQTGGFMGLSFAIPMELAMNVVDQLRTNGKVSRGYLGVLIQDVTRELADTFGLDHPRGALVAEVVPDSPAEAAGIQVGDVILSFNGKELLKSSELPPMVGFSKANEKATLRILRNGKTKTLVVKLGELPAEAKMASHAKPKSIKADRLGLVVTDPTDVERKRLDLGDSQGVLVSGVQKGAAKSAGIRKGDFIMMINGQKVKDAKQFEKLVDSLPAGKTVAVLVRREGGPSFLALKVPAKD